MGVRIKTCGPNNFQSKGRVNASQEVSQSACRTHILVEDTNLATYCGVVPVIITDWDALYVGMDVVTRE